MITLEGIDDIVVNGGVVVTSDGAKLGSVEQVFLSEDSGQPAFVTVRTGLFGMLESFVPLAGATIDGPRVVVAYDRDRIRNGPRIESDRGSITAAEEKELYDYYGTSAPESAGSTESVGSAGSAEPAEPGVSVESAALAADAAGHPEPQVQSPGAPPTPEHPHPHPHDGPHPHPAPGPHDGPHPVPPHLRKHEVDGRPHPHDGPHPHPHPPHDVPPPPPPQPRARP